MRYELGLMDQFSLEACGTCVENDPLYKITLRDAINPVRLEDAVYKALRFHPLFSTQISFDGEYYLETNNRPIKLVNVQEDERPLRFGKETNGYPWQMCWYDNVITFEWSHGITDGNGAIDFMRHVLTAYCGAPMEEIPRRIDLGPGLEPFFDRKERGIDYKIEPKGFSFKQFPAKDRMYQSDSHVLTTDTANLVRVSREVGGSVSVLFAILFSRAIRMHLPMNMRNRRVAANMLMDLRKPLNYQTQHNCVEIKRMTYLDEYDNMSLSELCSEYHGRLKNAMKKENIVRAVTDRVTTFRAYHVIKNKKLRRNVLNMICKSLKDNDCNFTVSYLGKLDFPKEVCEQLVDFRIDLWHDFDECVLVCLDYNGKFTLNICENFVEQGIVEDFVAICRDLGIEWEMEPVRLYTQALFEEETGNYFDDKQPESEKTVSLGDVHRELAPSAPAMPSPVYSRVSAN